EEIAELQPQAREEKDLLADYEKRLNLINNELVVENTVLAERSAAFNQENLHFHQQQNKVNSIDQEISYKQTTFDTSSDRIGNNQEDLNQTGDEATALLDRRETNEEELLEMNSEKTAI